MIGQLIHHVTSGQLPIIIHLEIGSLVPPRTHMAGPRFPFPLRYFDKVVGFLVPRSKASSPVPVPRPPFRFLFPPFRFLVLIYRFITLSYQWAIYEKYDRRGCEWPSGYGA